MKNECRTFMSSSNVLVKLLQQKNAQAEKVSLALLSFKQLNCETMCHTMMPTVTTIASETTKDKSMTFHANNLATQVSNVNCFRVGNLFARSQFNVDTSSSEKKETLHHWLTLTEDKTMETNIGVLKGNLFLLGCRKR